MPFWGPARDPVLLYGGLSYLIATNLGHGPTVCMVPPAIVASWVGQANKYLARSLRDLPGPDQQGDFVEVIQAYGQANTGVVETRCS